MGAETEKDRLNDIDLPLASDPLTLSHHNGPAPETDRPEKPTVRKTAETPPGAEAQNSQVAPQTRKPADETVAGEAAPEKKPAPPAERVKICPKCAHRQKDFFACSNCGIIFRNWRPEMERELFASLPDEVYSTVQEMWRELENAWDSDEGHEKFIQFCKNNSAVPFASRAYRMRAAKNPADARASDNLRRCTEFAGSMLQLLAVPPRSPKSSSATPGQIAVVVAIGAVLLILVFMLMSSILK